MHVSARPTRASTNTPPRPDLCAQTRSMRPHTPRDNPPSRSGIQKSSTISKSAHPTTTLCAQTVRCGGSLLSSPVLLCLPRSWRGRCRAQRDGGGLLRDPRIPRPPPIRLRRTTSPVPPLADLRPTGEARRTARQRHVEQRGRLMKEHPPPGWGSGVFLHSPINLESLNPTQRHLELNNSITSAHPSRPGVKNPLADSWT